MAKVDKRQLSKIEFRRLQHKKNLEKKNSNSNHINILCLKHGDKYSADYVNKLYYGVTKNLTIPHKFYCLTDNANNINSNVQILELPQIDVTGWWYKPYIFSKNIPLQGTILYIDLDVVITGSLDKLFSYHPLSFCIIRDFNRVLRPSYNKFNSSVMKFPHGQLDKVWQKFFYHYKTLVKKIPGDQDFIFQEQKNEAIFFPNEWIMSWKWEIRKNRKFAPGGLRGSRKLATIEDVRPPEECCIAVFHGDPNPHLCDDPYIKETWIYKE